MLAAKAFPGNPYDGHTLSTVIPHVEKVVGNEIKSIIADGGYRGHGAPRPYDIGVNVSEQKRGVTKAIKRDPRRRAAVEPVFGHELIVSGTACSTFLSAGSCSCRGISKG